MQSWLTSGIKALVSGTIASITTTGALAALAKLEGKSAVQPINASSHWLLGERAGQVREVDAAHTAVGLATNHAATMFWAAPLERWLAMRSRRTPTEIVGAAAGIAGVAALVDYVLMPKRLTPGWEEVLPPRSMIAGFLAMTIGLAAGAMVTQELKDRM